MHCSSRASDFELRKAYARRAKAVHPDVNPTPEAAEEFQRVTEAYSVLRDEHSRKRYDDERTVEHVIERGATFANFAVDKVAVPFVRLVGAVAGAATSEAEVLRLTKELAALKNQTREAAQAGLGGEATRLAKELAALKTTTSEAARAAQASSEASIAALEAELARAREQSAAEVARARDKSAAEVARARDKSAAEVARARDKSAAEVAAARETSAVAARETSAAERERERLAAEVAAARKTSAVAARETSAAARLAFRVRSGALEREAVQGGLRARADSLEARLREAEAARAADADEARRAAEAHEARRARDRAEIAALTDELLVAQIEAREAARAERAVELGELTRELEELGLKGAALIEELALAQDAARRSEREAEAVGAALREAERVIATLRRALLLRLLQAAASTVAVAPAPSVDLSQIRQDPALQYHGVSNGDVKEPGGRMYRRARGYDVAMP